MWGFHFMGSSFVGVFTCGDLHIVGSSRHGVFTSWGSWGLDVTGPSCLGGSLCHRVFTSWGFHVLGAFTLWGLHPLGPPFAHEAQFLGSRPGRAARWRQSSVLGLAPHGRAMAPWLWGRPWEPGGGRWGRLGPPQKTSLGLLAGGGRRAPGFGYELCENVIKKANARALCWLPSHADPQPSFGPNGLKAWWQPPGGFGEHEGGYKAPKDPQNVQHNCLGCEPPLHQNRVPTRPGSELREPVPRRSKRTLRV